MGVWSILLLASLAFTASQPHHAHGVPNLQRRELKKRNKGSKTSKSKKGSDIFATWKPRSLYSPTKLRELVFEELLDYQKTVTLSDTERGELFEDFNRAFKDEEYLQHQFLMGTEKTSPLRLLNQLYFKKISEHAYSRQAVETVDSQLKFSYSEQEQSDMSSCNRAEKSLQRSKYLLNNSRLQASPKPERPPHVIFIIADDLGWSDIGFHDPGIFSPFIDRLHSQGVALNNYYVDLVCSPSRASFMTGRYPMTTGALDWFQRTSLQGLSLDEVTMGNMFKGAGYDTHFVGKWHLGYYSEESTPTFRGFDSFFGMYGGGADYYRHIASKNYDQRRDFTSKCGAGCSVLDYASDGTYSSHLFGEEAVRRIMNHETERPLFLVMSFQAVHGPAHVAPFNYEKKCVSNLAKSVSAQQSDPHNEYIAPLLTPPGLGALASQRSQQRRRKFAGVVTAMDNAIENITSALHHQGMLDNSLIVFTTDNGAATVGADAWGSSNFPFRGGKHTIWEGGTRGVGAVWGRPVSSASTFEPFVSEHLMHGVDWFPTFLELLRDWDAPLSNVTDAVAFDGVSQLKALRGPNEESPRSSFVYGNVRDYCSKLAPLSTSRRSRQQRKVGCGFGIRSGDWKLVYDYGGYNDVWPQSPTHSSPKPAHSKDKEEQGELCPDSYCLFNIRHDPLEKNEV